MDKVGRTCTPCHGTGLVMALCVIREDGPSGPDLVDCMTCDGTGWDPRPDSAIKAGHLLRQDRIATGLSLREQAQRFGISVVRLGELERGRE